MAKKTNKESAPAYGSTQDAKDKVTVGEDTGKTSPQQAAEARAEDNKAKEDKSVNRKLLSVIEDNLSPEQKRSDAVNEARHEHYKAIGTDYYKGEFDAAAKKAAAESWKQGKVKEHQKYSGWLTVTGVSSEDGRQISARFFVPLEQPVTEDGVFYRFKCHHDSAMREEMKIDPENKADPLLATAKG